MRDLPKLARADGENKSAERSKLIITCLFLNKTKLITGTTIYLISHR